MTKIKVSAHIKADGETKHLPPAGLKYTLKELQEAVGGYIEIWPTPRGMLMVANEEGRLNKLPDNIIASEIMQFPVCGDVLYVDPRLIHKTN